MDQHSRHVINRSRKQRAAAAEEASPLNRPGGFTSEFKLILFVIIANLVMWGVDVATEDFNMAIPSAVSTILAVGYKVSRTLVKLKGGDLSRGDEYSERLLGLLDMANDEVQEWRRQGANPNSPVQPLLRASPIPNPFEAPAAPDDGPVNPSVAGFGPFATASASSPMPFEQTGGQPWPPPGHPPEQPAAQLRSLRDDTMMPPPEGDRI